MKIIKLAINSMLHFRTYSWINILGMALSLACVITIFRYVYGEFTVDHFNKNIKRVFLTTEENSRRPGEARLTWIKNMNRTSTFVDLTEHPGVERTSHIILFKDDEIELENQKYNTSVLVADSNFLKILDYPVISGIDRLSEPNNALITKRFARKIFGNENPVGQTFLHTTGEIFTITGVIGETSTKATLSFDILISYNGWLSSYRSPQTLALLYPNVDYQTINKQYEAFFDMPGWNETEQVRFQLFPLSKVYFDKSIHIDNYVFKQGNYSYVKILMAVAVLILLVGVVSYINICTVVILRRGRELGIKKVFGAEGYYIFIQLVIENLLMTGLALILAFLFARVAHPLITNVLQLDLIPNIRFDLFLSLIVLFTLPMTTALYPFFRYQYSTAVNSMQNFDKIRITGSLRQIFLSFQYIITIIMIIVSLFFIKQLQFMLKAEPGYRIKNIIKVQFLKYIPGRSWSSTEEWQKDKDREDGIADEIVQKMNSCPLFTHWTYGNSPKGVTFPFKLPEGEFKEIGLAGVSESWLRLFDIQLKEGRLWDDQTDDFCGYYLIVTESFLKLFGIADFNNALLQPERRLWMSSLRPQEEMKTNPPYRIVGVVKDFNYLHLSQKSDPLAFYYSEGWRGYPLIASIVPGRTRDAIEFLRKLHDETIGGEFSYSFVEDEIREMYKEDKRIATIYSIFTCIAIFISALGLFGMSLFDVQHRRKEIAIRKVNGASVLEIIRLLLKKYYIALAISFVIAAPVALLAINRYLEDFANKAPVSWWLFVAAVAITASISLLTLIYQTVRAASQNPADVVKSE